MEDLPPTLVYGFVRLDSTVRVTELQNGHVRPDPEGVRWYEAFTGGTPDVALNPYYAAAAAEDFLAHGAPREWLGDDPHFTLLVWERGLPKSMHLVSCHRQGNGYRTGRCIPIRARMLNALDRVVHPPENLLFI